MAKRFMAARHCKCAYVAARASVTMRGSVPSHEFELPMRGVAEDGASSS